MQVNIIIFGQLRDLLGENLALYDIPDTEHLITELNKMVPALANAKYAMAVDKKMVTGNILLNDQCTVALMPPFSGG